jgi:3-dehydroquinate dehydratase II
MKILILNGPNLNLLGKREPHIYGSVSFEQYFEELQVQFQQHAFVYFQSNHEGALLDCLHSEGMQSDGIIINAGAYTHTSIALHDALKAIAKPAIEVHISNVYAREPFRQVSYLKAACKASVVGLGLSGYAVAVEALASVLELSAYSE